MTETLHIGATTEAPPRTQLLPSHVYIGYGPALGFHASCACGKTDVLGNPHQAVMGDAEITRAIRWAYSHPCVWRRK